MSFDADTPKKSVPPRASAREAEPPRGDALALRLLRDGKSGPFGRRGAGAARIVAAIDAAERAGPVRDAKPLWRRPAPLAAALVLGSIALFVYDRDPGRLEPPAAGPTRSLALSIPLGIDKLVGRSARVLGDAVDEPLMEECEALVADADGVARTLMNGVPRPLVARVRALGAALVP
ncbi:MAG: hypothetical protein GY711_18455 [bacterium]|nr:hypothetical protein [bacterium]